MKKQMEKYTTYELISKRLFHINQCQSLHLTLQAFKLSYYDKWGIGNHYSM